jgi:hypothetical protein
MAAKANVDAANRSRTGKKGAFGKYYLQIKPGGSLVGK